MNGYRSINHFAESNPFLLPPLSQHLPPNLNRLRASQQPVVDEEDRRTKNAQSMRFTHVAGNNGFGLGALGADSQRRRIEAKLGGDGVDAALRTGRVALPRLTVSKEGIVHLPVAALLTSADRRQRSPLALRASDRQVLDNVEDLAGLNEFCNQSGKGELVITAAEGATEIGELDDGHRCGGITKHGVGFGAEAKLGHARSEHAVLGDGRRWRRSQRWRRQGCFA